jgi:dolichol-phosphate mannosyltransferase
MKLTVIIPVYNEKNTIAEIVKRVQAVPLEKEVIVVDDGSTDSTGNILREVSTGQGKGDIKVILKRKNEGKGSAIREGLKYVSGDFVVIQDGDLEYDPMDWIEMLKVMDEKRAAVVYGSRVLGRGEKSSFAFYFGGRLLSFLVNILYGAKITDEPTCYKMFRSGVIKSLRLKCTRFEFCPEVTAKVLRSGHKIREVPISYKPRKISEGKKIRWKDGVEAIWTLLKYRFVKW